MGSPRRSRSSSLHRREEENDDSTMRFGSIAMDEPCLVASVSPSSKDNSNSTHNAAATVASSPDQGSFGNTRTTEGETKSNKATASATVLSSPNEASSTSYTSAFGSSQQQQNSPRKTAKSPLHIGLGKGSDKTPYRSAAPSSSNSSSNRTQRKPFLSRVLSSSVLSSSVGSKQRWKDTKLQRQIESRQQQQQRPSATEGRHPEESSTPLLGGEESVLSPASTVQSSKTIPNNSNSKRRSRKPSIKFLKRALSSPPILLQRFHSNPIEKERLDTSGKIWQENNNNTSSRRLLPFVGSSSNSSSRSSVDLNNKNNNNNTITVVPKLFSPTSTRSSFQKKAVNQTTINVDDEENETSAVNKAHCSATSILHHTYLPVLETLCGVPQLETLLDNNNISNKNMKSILPTADRQNTYDIRNQYYTQQHPNNNNDESASHRQIPEDPTVQESIECIFASQLEDGLKLWDEDYDDDRKDAKRRNNGSGSHLEDDILGHRSFETLQQVRTSSSSRDGLLVSPSVVQQSRMNRKDRNYSSKFLFANMSQTKKRYEQASLVYVGTFDPSTPKNSVPNANSTNLNDSASNDPNDTSLDVSTVYSNLPVDPLPCSCATSFLPSVEPKDWPQAPLACRPTPGRGTKIKAIRFSNSNSKEPLWVPGSHLTWSQRLEQHWSNETEQEQRRKRDQQPHYACCEKCVLLPINNGNEAPGESLVIDFESELFEGSFLLRLRHSEGTTPEPYDDSTGYFTGMNRRYQACVRGRFKKVLPFTELKTGFRLDRKFGKLPSKWVLKGALKVVTFFAPQLEIKFEGVTKPYSTTPLGSSPQCINVDDENENEHNCSDDENQSDTIEHSNAQMNLIEGIRVESSEAHRSLLGIGTEAKEKTPFQRAKMRKKAFDKLYAQKAQEPKTDPSKIYTFEFLQHMMNFQEFSIDLGNMMGSLKLEEMLNGQPLPIMACHGDQYLWSFDVWNECLWEQAKKHNAIEQQQRGNIAGSP